MKLKFEPFCSSWDALSNEIFFFAKVVSGQKPWTIVRHFDQISFCTHNSSLEAATIDNRGGWSPPLLSMVLQTEFTPFSS